MLVAKLMRSIPVIKKMSLSFITAHFYRSNRAALHGTQHDKGSLLPQEN
jgi:hypothetical protein